MTWHKWQRKLLTELEFFRTWSGASFNLLSRSIFSFPTFSCSKRALSNSVCIFESSFSALCNCSMSLAILLRWPLAFLFCWYAYQLPMIAVKRRVTKKKSFHRVPVSKISKTFYIKTLIYTNINKPLGGPNNTASIAFKAIFCLWMGSFMPSTLLTKCKLLTANRGRTRIKIKQVVFKILTINFTHHH